MARARTIKGPAKRGTITERQARATAREIFEERSHKKANMVSRTDSVVKRSARSGKYHRSTKRSRAKESTSTKRRS